MRENVQKNKKRNKKNAIYVHSPPMDRQLDSLFLLFSYSTLKNRKLEIIDLEIFVRILFLVLLEMALSTRRKKEFFWLFCNVQLRMHYA